MARRPRRSTTWVPGPRWAMTSLSLPTARKTPSLMATAVASGRSGIDGVELAVVQNQIGVLHVASGTRIRSPGREAPGKAQRATKASRSRFNCSA